MLTVKLDCEVPGFTGDFEALEPEPRDNAVLQDIYETYGFRSWLRELTADPTRVPAQDARVEAETPAAPAELDYQTVTTKEQLQSLLSLLEKAELVALMLGACDEVLRLELTALAPEAPGQVRVHGEIWRASSSVAVPPGRAVRITAVTGLTLVVEPAEPPAAEGGIR